MELVCLAKCRWINIIGSQYAGNVFPSVQLSPSAQMFCTCTWQLVFATHCAAFTTLSFRVWHVFRGRVFARLKRRIGSKIEFKNMIKPLDIIIREEDPLCAPTGRYRSKTPYFPVHIFLSFTFFSFISLPIRLLPRN